MNYIDNAQDEIDEFAVDNSELAQHFAIKLSHQLQGLVRDNWDSEIHTKEDVLTIVLEEDNVLQQFCDENNIDMQDANFNVDFDLQHAIELQHIVIDAITEFFELE